MRKISVVIPAHNEEKYVVRCINSIKAAAKRYGGSVEAIVVCNRCTDNTEQLAKSAGVRVVTDESRCIAQVRNTGIAAARGDVIITIDCDNRMTPDTINEVCELLDSGKYIGGGAPIRFERLSFPLWMNELMCDVGFAATGLYCGMFWAEKSAFDAIGGFADIRAMEDVATAKKLRAYGKKLGKKYGCLKKNYLINSTRKYDDMGDWLYLKLVVENVGAITKAALGNYDEWDKLIDKMFYEYNDK